MASMERDISIPFEPGHPPERWKRPFIALTATMFLLLARVARAEEPPARVLAVEVAPSSYNGPGYVFRKGHPARFQVTIVNTTDDAQDGALAGEVVGNLDATYGLPPEAFRLGPRERRAVTLSWEYSFDATYDAPSGSPARVPGPRWGHELRVGWREGSGPIRSHGRAVFAVETDGGVSQGLKISGSPPTRAQVFRLRYSGYLSNPAMVRVEAPTDFDLHVSRGKARAWRRGQGPAGSDTCL